MKRRTIAFAAVAALLVVLPAIALGGSARTASNTQTYPDSTGEDPAAPDITSVVVSNDDTGLITFQVNVSNRPTMTPDMLFDIFLDTDKNPATGDPQSLGADYVIELVPGSVGLFQWNGSAFTGASSQSSLVFSYTTAGPTIRVNARDLGATKGFNFVVDATSGITTDASGNPDFTNAHDDLAPDPGHGTFAYQVLIKVSLSVQGFNTGPTPAKAGKRFSAGLAVAQSDTGGAVQAGTVTCSARIAGKPLPAQAHRIVNGVAVCVWVIPKKAKGKTIRGTVSVSVQGAQASRSFSAPIT